MENAGTKYVARGWGLPALLMNPPWMQTEAAPPKERGDYAVLMNDRRAHLRPFTLPAQAAHADHAGAPDAVSPDVGFRWADAKGGAGCRRRLECAFRKGGRTKKAFPPKFSSPRGGPFASQTCFGTGVRGGKGGGPWIFQEGKHSEHECISICIVRSPPA